MWIHQRGRRGDEDREGMRLTGCAHVPAVGALYCCIQAVYNPSPVDLFVMVECATAIVRMQLYCFWHKVFVRLVGHAELKVLRADRGAAASGRGSNVLELPCCVQFYAKAAPLPQVWPLVLRKVQRQDNAYSGYGLQ